jgi:hypothetical protein
MIYADHAIISSEKALDDATDVRIAIKETPPG